MLLAKLRDGAAAGTARMALEMATLGGAACLGRAGELGVLAPGAVADLAVWSLTGPTFAGAVEREARARLHRYSPKQTRERAGGGGVGPRTTTTCLAAGARGRRSNVSTPPDPF